MIQASKSILLQCNKLNYGLIFSSFQGVRDGRAAAHRPHPGTQLLGAALCRADSSAVAIRAGRDRRPHARRQHGCDCGAHPARRAAVLCPRGALDGRLSRAHDHAAGARARAEARAARYFGAAGNAGAKRAAQAPDRARRKRPIRRNSGAAVSVFRPSQPPRRRSAARACAPHGRGDRSAGLLAPAAGDHDAARCAAAVGGDQMSDVGARRRRRCADPAGALARDRRRDRGIAARHRCRLRTPFDHGAAGGGQ